MTDRLSDEDLPIIEDLGAWLRRERERAGVTLETIAARTKVARTLLEALERNDVSRWPNGIFRRAFVRGYANQIGLDPDYAVALFIRAFDGPHAASPAPGSGHRAAAAAAVVRRPGRAVAPADAGARSEPVAGSAGPSRRGHHRPDGADHAGAAERPARRAVAVLDRAGGRGGALPHGRHARPGDDARAVDDAARRVPAARRTPDAPGQGDERARLRRRCRRRHAIDGEATPRTAWTSGFGG